MTRKIFNSNVLLFIVLMMITSACTKKAVVTSVNDPMFYKIEQVTIHESYFGTGPCEPTISINPLNTLEMVAGSVLDNVYHSKDGGRTWIKSKLKSSHGVYGDPVVRFDNLGNVYYSHLANSAGKAYNSVEFLDRIVVQKSSNNGVTWTDGTYPAVNHIKDHDKQWKFIDPLTQNILMTWTEFDKYGSKNPDDKSRILFSVSKDQGSTWSNALAISDLEGDCLDDDMTTEGAHPAVGIDGTYFVVWAFNENIYFDQSSDGGKTWGSDRVIAKQKGGWSFDIPGIGRCNGFPVITVDHSNGPNRGTIYVKWSDQSKGETDTDIWLIKSPDFGKTWTKPTKINDDKPGKHQFFSWMDIDQTNGNLYVVFYDRRAYSDNQTDVYMAYSINGGDDFVNIKINDKPFTPKPDAFFGDYNDISAHNGIIRPIWTQYENRKLSVHTAIIDHIKTKNK